MTRPVATVAHPAAEELLIAAHDAVVRRVEDFPERFARDGAADDAAASAQVAAVVGWMNLPGGFASARLERTLRAGAAALPSFHFEGGRRADTRRVLHVLTAGYDTGGHT